MGDPGQEQGQEQEQEQELRILLERAVPRLPTPEGRLDDVRQRVVRTRRRRRRTAGAAAVTVTGLVVAGVLLPGLLPGGERPALPASPAPSITAPSITAPSVTAPPAPAPSLSATTDPGEGLRTRFPQLGALSLRLLPGWQAPTVRTGTPATPSGPGYLANQPLAPYDPDCSDRDSLGCRPLRTLLPSGALARITAPVNATDQARLAPANSLSSFCQAVGAAKEYIGAFGGPAPVGNGAASGADAAFTVTLCLGSDSPGIVEDVHTMISSADFGTEATEAPEDPTSPTPSLGTADATGDRP
ncbi:hypothetical protein [Streptomyces sp. NPDC093109]|uniref:hypothetical protein n=1 Tax=Streptomyces sp. NPDC093109 TaxID=3154977 RepID=UPI0034508874